ncbi:MAG: MucR family transcriptional regulator [Alphaproteobacteria bacterium]
MDKQTPHDKKEKTACFPVLRMASDIVSSYVSNNPLPAENISAVLEDVFLSLKTLGAEECPHAKNKAKFINQKPAVPIRKSVKDDFIICLEDGKELKMLKRYLRTKYNMTPDEYRTKWGLPSDYPMVAPSYAIKRSQVAKEIGLGKNGLKNNEKHKG